MRFCAPGEFHYGFRLLIGGFVNPLSSGMRERGVWFLLLLSFQTLDSNFVRSLLSFIKFVFFSASGPCGIRRGSDIDC